MNDSNNAPVQGCPVSALSDTYMLSNEELEALYKTARAETPVTYLNNIGYWAITKFDDIKAVLGDKEKFSAEITMDPLVPLPVEVRQLLENRGFNPLPKLSCNEGPDHALIRKHTQAAFTPGRFNKLEPFIRQLVNDAVDSFEADKRADIVKQMVYELPALVLFKIVGVPEEDVAKVKRWADSRLLLTFGKQSLENQLLAAQDLADFWHYCRDLVDQRVKAPQDDLPSDMLAQSVSEDGEITIENIKNVLFGLLLAGHETTTNQSANAILTLLQHRESWEAIVADPDLIPNAVEECIRFRPPVVGWRRLAKCEVELSGVKIPAGEKLLCFLPSGNRDEAHVENGEAFDIYRKDSRSHISFGFGRHFCLGAPLARFELKIILEELTKRLPGLRLATGQDFQAVEAVQFRGPKELWVEWD